MNTRNIRSIERHGRRILFGLLLLVVSAVTALAQTTSNLSGTVQDNTGAVIPGASITLTNDATKEVRHLTSNDAGYFSFAGIVPGTYTVDVDANGFTKFRQPGVVLNPGDTRSLSNLALVPSSGNGESITVSSPLNVVAPEDSGERAAVLEAQDIQRLPISSRNTSELLKVLPGVTTTASGTGNGTGFDFTDNGSSGSAVGVGLNTNGAPYRGGTAYLLDGASIIDPGCACWSIATVNPDMTQEVKVQTSNFGADAAQGPVVINVISRSGGAGFHGQAYLYVRNAALNANTWANKHNQPATPLPDASYYYPGGSIGGPILFPGTSFNHNRKLLFWAGYENFRQTLPAAQPLTSFVPTAAMRAGNFSLSDPDNAALCARSAHPNADFCSPLNGYAPNGTAFAPNTWQIPAAYIDSNAVALMSLFPQANTNPAANGSGYNYYLQPTNVHNGYIYRGRVDYNISERNKVFVSYQYGSDSETTPAHIWYSPTNSVAYPGGPLVSAVHSHVLSGSYIHTFSGAATNELRIAAGWLDNPFTASNLQNMSKTKVGYTYNTIYNSASALVPSINSAGDRTLPDISQPDIFQGGAYNSIKRSPSVADDFTVVYKTHTFKVGGYWSQAGNKQGTYGTPNGTLSYGSSSQPDQITGLPIGTSNPLANFMMGITSGYTQVNTNPISDMHYNTGAGYFLDNWKILPQLTLNLGLRVEHLGRWQDASGTGLAVWRPEKYAADIASGKAYPGVYWHALDPSLPNGGSPVQTLFLEPRLGLAYDVFRNGHTIVRGGWAQYRWNDQFNDYAGPLTTALGVRTFNSTNNNNITLKEISNLSSSSSSVGSLPSSVYATDQNDDKVGVTSAYNLTISQRIPHGMLLEVAYVGNNTQNILMGGQSNGSGVGGSNFINQNKIPLGGLFKADPVTGAPAPTNPENVPNIVDYYPYYKGYGSNAITVASHVAYSNYNGAQVSLLRQRGRATFNVNYTYSKALGIIGSTLDAFNVRNNYGVLNIDRPHVINTSYAFELGSPIHGNAFAAAAVNGWTLTGTTTWQAGGNMQANIAQNLNMTINVVDSNGNKIRSLTSNTYYGTPVQTVLPVLTCNPNSGLGNNQHINLACVTAPQIGQVGLRQMPYLSLPAYFNSDLGIYKSFRIHEGQAIELRGMAFNFLNHPLPGYSGSSFVQPTLNTTDNKTFTPAVSPVGRGVTDSKYTQRTMLLAIKYSF